MKHTVVLNYGWLTRGEGTISTRVMLSGNDAFNRNADQAQLSTCWRSDSDDSLTAAARPHY
jgi:hypothetical protein